MPSVMDLQKAAIRDDGSREGILQVALEQSGLTLLPFPGLPDTSAVQNSKDAVGSSFNFNSIALIGSWLHGYWGISATTAAAANSWFRFQWKHPGRVVGIYAFGPSDALGWSRATCMIDGQAYAIPESAWADYDAGTYLSPWVYPLIIAKDLPDTLHQVEIRATGSVADGARAYFFGGILVESRLGIPPAPLTAQRCGSKVIDTTNEITLNTSGYITYTPLAITRISAYNSDTSAQTLKIGGATGVVDEILNLAAGYSGAIDFNPPLMRAKASLFLTASVADKIRLTVYGVY